MRAVAILLELLLFPGAGHVLAGRYLRGALWFTATLAVLVAGAFVTPWLLWVGLALRVPSVFDLARPPRGAGSRWPRPRAALLAIAAGLLITLATSAIVRALVVEAFRIPASSGAPTLTIDDRILVDKLSYRLGPPTVGDLAVFVHPCDAGRDFVKRVVAVAGQTVEIRCDALFVDGVAVPTRPEPGACSYRDVDDVTGESSDAACRAAIETRGDLEVTVFHQAGPAPTEDGAFDFPSHGAPGCEGGAPLGELAPPTPSPATGCGVRQAYRVPPGHAFVLGDNRANSADSRLWGPVPYANLQGRATGIWWPFDRIGRVR